jgi:histidine transport system substrate-binding protein
VRAFSPVVRVLLVLLAAGSAHARDLADVRRDRVLRVLVMPDTRLREFVDLESASRPGFDLEILEGFARAHKAKVAVIRVGGWDELIPALLKDEGDVIAGCFTDTEARRRQIHFTQAVFPTGAVVVTRKPHRVVSTLEELREEKVGTIRGTSMDDALAAAGFKGKVDYAAVEGKDLSTALRAGAITAAVWSAENAVAAAHRDGALQIGLMLGEPTALAYGVRKEDAELLSALNAHLSTLRRTGVWQRLAVRYLGAAAKALLKDAQKP